MHCLAQLRKRRPAWDDPSDEFKKRPKGDDCEKDATTDDEEDHLELQAGDVRAKEQSLETKILSFKHLTNLNNDLSYKGSVCQVQFHPRARMAIVGVKMGQLALFEVDGERNRFVQNIKLPRTNNPFCRFKPDGNSIVISSDKYRGNFYTYDMISAHIKTYKLKVGSEKKTMTDFTFSESSYMACRNENSHEVIVLSSQTYENMFSIKANEPVQCVQFTDDNNMFVAGADARVYVWDLRNTSKCKHKFQDEGSVHTSSFAISGQSNQLAVGSDCGTVNSYELETCLKDEFPKPFKTFANLNKAVDLLKYNPTGELMLMSSSTEPGAFRIAHSYSAQVYRNFPVPGKKYGHLLCADFSPMSGYLALGTTTGRAYLCRIPHYKCY